VEVLALVLPAAHGVRGRVALPVDPEEILPVRVSTELATRFLEELVLNGVAVLVWHEED
jgi:hypothetical protein